MESFAESLKTNTPIDWGVTLDRLILNGPTSEMEAQHLSNLSESWITCGVGNQCAVIPRKPSGAPEDVRLKMLGVAFHRAIDLSEWKAAKETLTLIEIRSAELIAQINGVDKSKY